MKTCFLAVVDDITMKIFGDNNRRSNRPLAIIITSRLLFPLLLTIIMQGSHAIRDDGGNEEE